MGKGIGLKRKELKRIGLKGEVNDSKLLREKWIVGEKPINRMPKAQVALAKTR